jgi:peptidyl-prolyl cis-trans isomerase A (cyclophilin A)
MAPFMTRARSALILGPLAVLTIASTAHAQAARTPGIVPVRVETSLGMIDIDIDSAHAPISATNFLRYVDAGAYSSGRFHRTVTPANQPNDTVRIAVVQAGPHPQREGARFPAIPLERTSVTGLRHVDGAISMARGGPNTATSDFFIVIGAQPSLDEGGHRNLDGQGFAAFGQVVRGMDVVRRIQQSPADAQTLAPPVTIVRIARIPRS